MPPIITLTTDFGEIDGYIAAMKGVILGICPGAHLVDVTHLVAPQSIRSAAYVLKTIVPYFPAGTVHLAVVDPGVGSERKAVAIRTEGCIFVGPENGLFSFALRSRPPLDVRCIENSRYILSNPSATFHGRDIFAPAAAFLASGIPIEALGPPCPLSDPKWANVMVERDRIKGEIIHIDRFGNCITNIEKQHLRESFHKGRIILKVGNHTVRKLSATYSDVPPGTILALIGSFGHVEIAFNGGHAASLLNVGLGHGVEIFRVKSENIV